MIRFGLTLAAAWLLALTAQAQRVAIDDFKGPRSNQAHKAVVGALLKNTELVPLSDVLDAADELGVSMASPDGRVAVSRKLRLSAFVQGEVERGKRWKLQLRVFNGADGQEVGTAEISGRARRFRRRVAGRAWRELKPLIEKTSPPEEEKRTAPVVAGADEEKPPAMADDEEDGDEEGVSAGDIGEAWSTDDIGEPDPRPESVDGLVIDLGFGIGARTYAVNPGDDASNLDGLPDYTLAPWGDSAGVVPNLDLRLQIYGQIAGLEGFLADVGLDVHYQLVFGIDSEDAQTGTKYETEAGAWTADLRFRFPTGALEPALFVGVGQRKFKLEQNAGVPAVAYTSVRVGGDARYTGIDGVALQLKLGLLLPQGYGALVTDDWYPKISGLGLLSELRAGFPISSAVEPFLAVGYERYGLSFDPQVGSRADALGRVAGGALDEYYQLLVGSSLRF